jgi:hypothetical protein
VKWMMAEKEEVAMVNEIVSELTNYGNKKRLI